ncbi:MAG: hypothetical protein JWN37_67 [Candidatus Nomurabacteria bacterium]|nr:hypothetical protein [Candidatus Nomurabacteria bacterium]
MDFKPGSGEPRPDKLETEFASELKNLFIDLNRKGYPPEGKALVVDFVTRFMEGLGRPPYAEISDAFQLICNMTNPYAPEEELYKDVKYGASNLVAEAYEQIWNINAAEKETKSVLKNTSQPEIH